MSQALFSAAGNFSTGYAETALNARTFNAHKVGSAVGALVSRSLNLAALSGDDNCAVFSH
jgi:hypothetical protein